MDIYQHLTQDHDKVKDLLNRLVALNGSSYERGELIDQIRDALIPHSRAEEAVFYNSLRASNAGKDIVMHGYQEHMEAEMQLRMLQLRDKLDAAWKETAHKLRNALLHHIQEEEGKIFSVARQVFTPDEALMMGNAFEKLKPQVQQEGFMKTTLDLVMNLMPPRFASALRSRDWENHASHS